MKVCTALIFALLSVVNALHFYVNTDETKCFYEELPKDTIAVGKFAVYEFDDDDMWLYTPAISWWV
jgi:hypothetical protein